MGLLKMQKRAQLMPTEYFTHFWQPNTQLCTDKKFVKGTRLKRDDIEMEQKRQMKY